MLETFKSNKKTAKDRIPMINSKPLDLTKYLNNSIKNTAKKKNQKKSYKVIFFFFDSLIILITSCLLFQDFSFFLFFNIYAISFIFLNKTLVENTVHINHPYCTH